MTECPQCKSLRTWTTTKKSRLRTMQFFSGVFIVALILTYYDFRSIWVFLSFFSFFNILISLYQYRYNKTYKGCCNDCKHRWTF